jgi:uncharacterized membrane protein YkvA (DUF1232 family)
MIERWKQYARHLKGLIYALYYAYRDPRTPLAARIVAACVVGYAFSPIDLIPDPIPILGYLDDLFLLPLGIAFAIRLLPTDVWADAQHKALETIQQNRPLNRIAAAIIVLFWGVLALGGLLLVRRFIALS